VVVKSDCPISKLLRKPELAGRMITSSVELSESGLIYEPKGLIKSQCIADFVVELQSNFHIEDG